MSADVSRYAPHPAPDRLRLVQSFINTRRIETRRDDLGSPNALAVWLARHDLLPADVELDETAWRQARTAREGLRALVRRNSGVALAAAEVERLNHVFGEVQAGLRFAADGSLDNEECQLVFYDASRNRSGKWCTVRRCGNRINAKNYRKREPAWKAGRPNSKFW